MFPEHPLELRDCRRIAVAMGDFDGVHLGHQAIIANTVALARETGAVPVAMFFSPHPRAVLAPPGPALLTKMPMKAELLRRAGAERLVCVPFTRDFAALSPEDFLQGFFLQPGMEVTGFCVGYDWRFGRGNDGGADTLRKWATDHGMKSRVVDAVLFEGQPISSTRIREAVVAGDLLQAERMLGRKHSICGIVRHGNGIAKSNLSCPTANLIEPECALPPHGVYAAQASWDGRVAKGIVYVGTAPTIRHGEDEQVIIELHLFDVDENLYGKEIQVLFDKFLRPSRTFNSPQELAVQIQQDIAAVLSNRELTPTAQNGGGS